MSFGANQATKNATNVQSGLTQQATANSGTEIGQGGTQLAAGGQNINSGTNFLNTVLNGNRANTTALLQPNIDQIRQANNQQLQSLSTLSPRGGGRSGTLFNASYAPNQQIQNLFGQARTTAATALPQIGLAQQGIGTNLIGAGNSALNTGVQGADAVAQNQLAIQKRSDSLLGGLGGFATNLALAPVTGGGSLFGNFINCWIAQAVYGEHDIRTHAVRQWLNGEYARTKVGGAVMVLYRKFGRQIAPLVKGPLRWVLRPVFDMVLRKALA